MKKIPTIFKRDPSNNMQITQEPHPDCAWIFNGEGVPTRKYDGTCCKINADGYWKRREIKAGKSYPSDFVLEECDNNTGKSVGWVPISKTDPADKYHMEAYSSDLPHGVYELCGPKVQGNPEGFDTHILISIKELVNQLYVEVLNNVPRTYDGLRDFMTDLDIEGIVFHHPDGRMGKIKKRDYGMIRKSNYPILICPECGEHGFHRIPEPPPLMDRGEGRMRIRLIWKCNHCKYSTL